MKQVASSAWLIYSLTLKMKAMCSSKISGSLSKLHGVTTQKTVHFIVTAVKTSNQMKIMDNETLSNLDATPTWLPSSIWK
jgi:hypothetical protein